MFQEDGSSSSVTSSSLQMYPVISLSSGLMSPYSCLKDLTPEERGLYLIQLLVTCAHHVSSGSLDNANIVLDEMSHLASPNGDTMQRIASYFSEALAHRILRTWPGVYKAFRSTKMSTFAEENHARKMFSEFLPFVKVAVVISNQAIIEAMQGEKMVHVIDLNAIEPAQWCALIRDMSARPEGPPYLRITGIHHQKEVLQEMAHILTREAERLDLPFQFNPVVSKLENLDINELRVKTGEALAISSIMQLHTLLASNNSNNSDLRNHSAGVNNNDSASSSPVPPIPGIDSFLNSLWGLSPKVVVVTEQDSDHNVNSLMERLSESLYFYAALFDCLETVLPRASLERSKMERMLLGEEIKNIIACEGVERRQRHEKLEKWSKRFDMAGFGNVPLSYYGVLHAKRLLQSFKCDEYKIREDNGCVAICWQDRRVFSVSAWRYMR